MIEWQLIDTAPTGHRTRYAHNYLIASYPAGVVAIGRISDLDKDAFTTLAGTYHPPTHWAKLNTPEEASLYPNWHQEAKEHEQAFMSAKDDYAEVARALGFTETTFFGDPMAMHGDIVARAKEAFAALTTNATNTGEITDPKD